jgi:ATP phosphoribosyltransferase regulatory subunit
MAGAIVAPAGGDAALDAVVAGLREQGEVVVALLPGEAGGEGPACDRRLVQRNGSWVVEPV